MNVVDIHQKLLFSGAKGYFQGLPSEDPHFHRQKRFYEIMKILDFFLAKSLLETKYNFL